MPSAEPSRCRPAAEARGESRGGGVPEKSGSAGKVSLSERTKGDPDDDAGDKPAAPLDGIREVAEDAEGKALEVGEEDA